MAFITHFLGKRPRRWFSVDHNRPSPNSSRFKKRKVSSTMSNKTPSPLSTTTNATVSRISRYPETKPPLHREVHAPCSRPRKFDLATNSKSESSDLMAPNTTNVLMEKYERAKYSALATIPLRGKEKKKCNHKEVVLEDSNVEDVLELRSVVKDRKLKKMKKKGLVCLDDKVEVVNGAIQQQSTSPVVDAAKMLDDLSLSSENDLSGVRAYKKLLEAVDKRGDTLARLKFEIQLNEKRKSSFGLLRPKKELVEVAPKEPFVPLTKEEEVEVAQAFSTNQKKVLVNHEKSNIEISGKMFRCLRPGAWLNDEVINLYLELLKERERREPQKFLNCHFFSTFFYKKLISGENGYDYKSVRRWTTQKKLGYGLHECDKIFVPIHQQIHWCLAVINKKEKKFQYLDSLKGIDTQVLEVLVWSRPLSINWSLSVPLKMVSWHLFPDLFDGKLRKDICIYLLQYVIFIINVSQERYFVDEVKDKTGEDVDVSYWEKEFVEDLPEQMNGYDCGVFMVKYADFYSRNLRLCFNQEHMPYFRLRTAKEILRLKAD